MGNSIVQYLGIAIGFLNVTILFPNIFTADQFGLTRILVAIAALYAQFSALGTQRTLVRFMPMFRTVDNKNNGLLLIGVLAPSLGFLLFTLVYSLFQDPIVGHYHDRSSLFTDNYFTVVPFAFFWLCTFILEFYLIGMFRTVFSNFLRHVLVRILWTADILLYHFGVVDWDTFLWLFIGAYAVNAVVLAVYLMLQGGWYFRYSERFRRRLLFRAMRDYSLFSIFFGVSNFFVKNIDLIMIGALMVSPLENVGYYAIAVYVASVIQVPALAIARISFPLIADKWRNKDLAGIAQLYRSSALNQLILGGALFVLLWSNVHNIFQLMPPEYATAKWALFFLGLAKLIDMAMGVNGTIINATRFYRFDLYSSLLLIVVIVTANYFLIQWYGLTGAAVATAISLLLFNGLRFAFLLVKLKMQPIEWRMVLVALLLVAVFFLQRTVPPLEAHFIFDLLLRSAIVALAIAMPVYLFRLSPDIRTAIDNMISR